VNFVNKGQVLELSTYEGQNCVSLYLPTHRAGAETQQNPIRFKNLLQQAREKLQAAIAGEREFKRFLRPLEQRVDDYDFWQHQAEGLAVFRSADAVHWLQTFWSVPELCVVGQRYHVKPLLPALNGEGDFFVLCVGARSAKLFRGIRTALEEVTPASVPEIFAEATAERGRPPSQMHSAGAAAVHHGHNPADFEERILRGKLHRVAREISGAVTNQGLPVILAGADEVRALYRSVAGSVDSLLEDGIPGSCESLSAHELGAAAWPVADAHFRSREEAAKADFETMAARGLTATGIEQVLVGSADGRVRKLFVAVGRQVWGRFDAAARQARLFESADAEDLLNEAAVRTLRCGGEVYALTPDRMPQGALAAAVFRY
jgi:hypothetical protein